MNSHTQDEELRRLLQAHDTARPKITPGFRAAVWARIEARRREPATWWAWVGRHAGGIATAAAASVALTAGAAGWVATQQHGRERELAVERYVSSIDPHRQVVASIGGSAAGEALR